MDPCSPLEELPSGRLSALTDAPWPLWTWRPNPACFFIVLLKRIQKKRTQEFKNSAFLDRTCNVQKRKGAG
jgi:hypothetical protein